MGLIEGGWDSTFRVLVLELVVEQQHCVIIAPRRNPLSTDYRPGDGCNA